MTIERREEVMIRERVIDKFFKLDKVAHPEPELGGCEPRQTLLPPSFYRF